MTIKTIGFSAGLLVLLFTGFGSIEPSFTASHSRQKKKSFSYAEADELLARYIPQTNLLTARFMIACQGTDTDIRLNRALLKKLAHSHVNIDRLTDEEVNTICYFLGQLTV